MWRAHELDVLELHGLSPPIPVEFVLRAPKGREGTALPADGQGPDQEG